MVEREKFKILVKGMKAVYAHPSFIPDQDAFNVWYAMLNDLSYEYLNAAVQKHMMTNTHPPTIADIRGEAARLSSGESEMSELKAWGMVRKAVSNSNYHSEEEFERLPEAVRIAVGNPANLREWAMMPTETVESVEQSHFIKAYRAAVGRVREAAQMAPEIRKLYAAGLDEGTQRIGSSIAPPEGQLPEKAVIPMPDHAKQRLQELLGAVIQGTEKQPQG